jgi:8-oxo-dGTP diphosphatase
MGLGGVQPSVVTSRMSESRLAVKALIPRGPDELLLVRRTPHAGAANPLTYGPPGGAVEPGEKLEEALSREIAEETSLSVSISGIAGIREWSATHKDVHYVCVFFACEPISRRAVVSLNHENCEFLWATLAQLASLDLSESSRGIVEQFLGGWGPEAIPYHSPFHFAAAP